MKSSKNTDNASNKASAATIGKALDAAKVGASTISSIAGVFAEKQRTQQVKAQANAQIRQAEETTKQVAIQAYTDIANVDAHVYIHRLDHTETMQRMSDAHAVEMALHKQRERVLDKLLESTEGRPEQLVDGLRALLPDDRR